MTNTAALDQAVREVTTPYQRDLLNIEGSSCWRHCDGVLTQHFRYLTTAIRARYREIVAADFPAGGKTT